MMRLICLLLLPIFCFSQVNVEISEVDSISPLRLKYKFPIEIDSLLEANPESPPYQYAGTLFSFIGLEHEAFDNFHGRYNERKPLEDSIYNAFEEEYTAGNAKSYIIERAKKEQIVIINEAHHKGKHRLFTKELLQGLYNEGYRHLGLEALTLFNEFTDTLLNDRKYPTVNSGFYVIEPNFGNMIRTALEIGYQLFPYDSEGNGKEREINQAINIKNYLERFPEEKVLIHCGYDHAKEGELNSNWEKAMAGRLLEYTNINPLSINQTTFDSRWDSAYLNPLMQRMALKEPTVFIDSNSLSYLGEVDDKEFDIYIFHEQTKRSFNRPLWRKTKNDEIIEIDLGSINFSEPFLLMAFRKSEDYTKAIPEDLIYIDPILRKKVVHLILEGKEYSLIAQTAEGKAILINFNLP